MKKILPFLGVTIWLSGCSTFDQANVLRQSIDRGDIEGMTKENKFSISFPKNYHRGPYSKIDGLNVAIKKGTYEGQNATFFLGKSRQNGEWEIFSVMVEKDGIWQHIPINNIK